MSVWNIVSIYRLYAVYGVDDARVCIKIFRMLGTAKTANRPQSFPENIANILLW